MTNQKTLYPLQIPFIEKENCNFENGRNLNLITLFITTFKFSCLLSKNSQTYFKNYVITPTRFLKYVRPFSTLRKKRLRQHFVSSFLRNISFQIFRWAILYSNEYTTSHFVIRNRNIPPELFWSSSNYYLAYMKPARLHEALILLEIFRISVKWTNKFIYLNSVWDNLCL